MRGDVVTTSRSILGSECVEVECGGGMTPSRTARTVRTAFECPDGSDGVPEGRFRGVDRCVCADRSGDGLCFGDVAGAGVGGGVGVDVGDVGGVSAAAR